jgi:hypothetical protein
MINNMLVEIFISCQSKVWSSKPIILFFIFYYFIIIYLPDSMHLVERVNGDE